MPHYYYRQKQCFLKAGKELDISGKKRGSFVDEFADRIMKEEEKEFSDAFGTYSEEISLKQLEIVHKYWGPF